MHLTNLLELSDEQDGWANGLTGLIDYLRKESTQEKDKKHLRFVLSKLSVKQGGHKAKMRKDYIK